MCPLLAGPLSSPGHIGTLGDTSLGVWVRGDTERGQSQLGSMERSSPRVPRHGLGAELRLLSYFLKTRWVPPTAAAPSGARRGGSSPRSPGGWEAAWGQAGDLRPLRSPPRSRLPQMSLLPFQEGFSLEHSCPCHHPLAAQHGGCPEPPHKDILWAAWTSQGRARNSRSGEGSCPG